MNADHAASLSLFLRHYCHIPTLHAATARLIDISDSHMILTSSFGRNIVPIDPPLSSLSDARTRLVAMHRDCLQALGESDTIVTTWRAPQGFHLFLFVLCSFIFLSFSSRNNFDPEAGGWLYEAWSLGGVFPQLARFCQIIQPYLFTLMIVVHAGEASYLARSRMKKHGVKIFSRLWWVWWLDCFVEGFGCFERFDGIVTRMEEARAGKH